MHILYGEDKPMELEATVDELLDLFEQHEQPLCDICRLRSDCPQGVTGDPNGPHYPACADADPRQLIDVSQAARLALELLVDDANDHSESRVPETQRRGDPASHESTQP